MVSLIQPSIKYNSLTQLRFTNTPKEKLSRFDTPAENIIGNNFNVNTENMTKKHAMKTVKKCINGQIRKNFINYFGINDHNKATRNHKYLLKVPKIRLEF